MPSNVFTFIASNKVLVLYEENLQAITSSKLFFFQNRESWCTSLWLLTVTLLKMHDLSNSTYWVMTHMIQTTQSQKKWNFVCGKESGQISFCLVDWMKEEVNQYNHGFGCWLIWNNRKVGIHWIQSSQIIQLDNVKLSGSSRICKRSSWIWLNSSAYKHFYLL